MTDPWENADAPEPERPPAPPSASLESSAPTHAAPPPLPPSAPKRPPARPPKQKMSGGTKALIGCGIAAGAFFVLIIVALMAIGAAIEIGYMPDTVAKSQKQLPSVQLDGLREMGIVDADEPVLYFYSGGFWSISESGNVVTDRRVIYYETFEGELDVEEADLADVADVTFYASDSWIIDSTIEVELEDGDVIYLNVSTEERGDRKFHDKLVEQWNLKREK